MHQTDQSAISISRHFLTGFDRIWPDLTGFDRIWLDLTGFDWIWPDLTLWNVLEWYGHSSASKQTIQHFPTTFWPLTLWFFFIFYSSPDSSHTLWWIVEYSGGETSTLCQLEVSVWPCVCSTGCSRLVTHPGTNPARRCLTSVIWREPVCHRHLVVDKNAQECKDTVQRRNTNQHQNLTTALRRSVYTKKKTVI